jgi:cell division protein FtsL
VTGRRELLLSLGLMLAVAASGIGVVYAKHSSRRLFVEQEALRKERDNLEIERGRLELEQSTWASPARIEQEAHKKLNMRMVEVKDIVVIEH